MFPTLCKVDEINLLNSLEAFAKQRVSFLKCSLASRRMLVYRGFLCNFASNLSYAGTGEQSFQLLS